MSQKVKAIGLYECGKSSVLKNIEIEIPAPGPSDLKVRIMAVSINPVDVKIRNGGFTPPYEAPLVLGYDASGVVEAVGSEVKRFKIGDEVMYSGTHVRPGSNAEVGLVDEKLVGRKPKSFLHSYAAAVPLAGLTAWEALIERLGIPENDEPKNETLLIINGAGGVGSFATQIARNVLRLSNVIVTASRPETIEWCKGQGATHIINHRKPLKEQIEALAVTVDYALICYDTNAYLAEVVDIVRPFGKIAAIVDVNSDMPFGGAMLKAISFHWEFMFAKPMYEYDMLSQGLALDKIADYIDKGSLKRVDTKVYDDLNVQNLREVHDTVENGKAIGKIVLNVSDRSFQ